jgi:hypothetical protein
MGSITMRLVLVIFPLQTQKLSANVYSVQVRIKRQTFILCNIGNGTEAHHGLV